MAGASARSTHSQHRPPVESFNRGLERRADARSEEANARHSLLRGRQILHLIMDWHWLVETD
eukprot:2477741-Pyramimonas_sp.AAC.1